MGYYSDLMSRAWDEMESGDDHEKVMHDIMQSDLAAIRAKEKWEYKPEPEPTYAAPTYKYALGQKVSWKISLSRPIGEITELSSWRGEPRYKVKFSNDPIYGNHFQTLDEKEIVLREGVA